MHLKYLATELSLENKLFWAGDMKLQFEQT